MKFRTVNGAIYELNDSTFSRTSEDPLVHRGLRKHAIFQDVPHRGFTDVLVGSKVVIDLDGEDCLLTGRVKEIIEN